MTFKNKTVKMAATYEGYSSNDFYGSNYDNQQYGYDYQNAYGNNMVSYSNLYNH